MKKATKKEVLEMAIQKSEMYCDLVWLARVKPENYNAIPQVREHVKKISETYPDEVNNLNGEYGDFNHGFNSGCLAAFRMILTMMEYGVEESVEMFPELDS
jgi:hypothetical protein